MGDELPEPVSGERPIGSHTQPCVPPTQHPEVAIICSAVCACAQEEPWAPQRCVDKRLATEIQEQAGRYHDPKYATIHVQVPFDVKKGEALMSSSHTSSTHRDANGNPRPLPKPYPGWWSMNFARSNPGALRIPDIVITHSATDLPTGAGIKRIVEIKFPKARHGETRPSDWGDGQYDAYADLDPTGRPLVLTPKTCCCRKKDEDEEENSNVEPQQVPVPIPMSDSRGSGGSSTAENRRPEAGDAPGPAPQPEPERQPAPSPQPQPIPPPEEEEEELPLAARELGTAEEIEVMLLLAAAMILIADDALVVGAADDVMLIPIAARLAQLGMRL